MHQPKSAPPPSQPALPLEIPQRAGLRPETEEVVVDRCTPEQAWETLSPPGRVRLLETWLRVLKEVVDDAQDR
jgi:hypothetical protein